MTLVGFFDQHPKAALAFSGGTDSALLLSAAVRCGCDVQPYFIKTAFQPAFELADARRLCAELGADLVVLELDILANSTVAANPADRCYHCKTALFTALVARATADGYPVVIDGTNASDDADDRPGMRALRELGVVSPLRLCGITKDDVRRLSREQGLFTADKPSYACLATRIPTGTTITSDVLAKVERSEAALESMGFSDLRVRVICGTAKLQLPAAQLARAAQRAQDIHDALTPDFSEILLDLKPR